MILDPKGNPIPAPEPRHRFGHFEIPDDVRVKGFSTWGPDDEPACIRFSSSESAVVKGDK